MYWSNAMGDYVMLQGMDQGRVLYLVDGKRLAGRVSQRLNGQTLPLGRLDRRSEGFGYVLSDRPFQNIRRHWLSRSIV
jgi:hypothetical protein